MAELVTFPRAAFPPIEPPVHSQSVPVHKVIIPGRLETETRSCLPFHEAENLTFGMCAELLDRDRVGALYEAVTMSFKFSCDLQNIKNDIDYDMVINFGTTSVTAEFQASYQSMICGVIYLQSVRNILYNLIKYPYEIKDLQGNIRRPRIFVLLQALGLIHPEQNFEIMPMNLTVAAYYTDPSGSTDYDNFRRFLEGHMSVCDLPSFFRSTPRHVIRGWYDHGKFRVTIYSPGKTGAGQDILNRDYLHSLPIYSTLGGMSAFHLESKEYKFTPPSDVLYNTPAFTALLVQFLNPVYNACTSTVVASLMARAACVSMLCDLRPYLVCFQDTHEMFESVNNTVYLSRPVGGTEVVQNRFYKSASTVHCRVEMIYQPVLQMIPYATFNFFTSGNQYFKSTDNLELYVLPSIRNINNTLADKVQGLGYHVERINDDTVSIRTMLENQTEMMSKLADTQAKLQTQLSLQPNVDAKIQVVPDKMEADVRNYTVLQKKTEQIRSLCAKINERFEDTRYEDVIQNTVETAIQMKITDCLENLESMVVEQIAECMNGLGLRKNHATTVETLLSDILSAADNHAQTLDRVDTNVLIIKEALRRMVSILEDRRDGDNPPDDDNHPDNPPHIQANADNDNNNDDHVPDYDGHEQGDENDARHREDDDAVMNMLMSEVIQDSANDAAEEAHENNDEEQEEVESGNDDYIEDDGGYDESLSQAVENAQMEQTSYTPDIESILTGVDQVLETIQNYEDSVTATTVTQVVQSSTAAEVSTSGMGPVASTSGVSSGGGDGNKPLGVAKSRPKKKSFAVLSDSDSDTEYQRPPTPDLRVTRRAIQNKSKRQKVNEVVKLD